MMRHCTSVFLSRMPFFITRPSPLPSSVQLVMHILGSLTAGIQIQVCCRLQHYSVRLRLSISQVIITTYRFRYSLQFGRDPCSNLHLTCSVRPFFSCVMMLSGTGSKPNSEPKHAFRSSATEMHSMLENTPRKSQWLPISIIRKSIGSLLQWNSVGPPTL
jgi:hypothetical protein